MSKQYSDVPKWELYKENAAPLERGRDVEKLSRALVPESTTTCLMHRKQQDKNIRTFERLVRPVERFAKLYEENQTRDEKEIHEILSECKVDEDPIVHWLRYIKYHEDTYPSDTHAQFLLKERCTHSLLHHPKYTNDVRFIRVCVLYADRTENPHEEFKLFHQYKIGSEVAIFWLAWAWVAEKRKDFQFADKIFRKAIQKKAQPAQIVNQRYKQFQRRMSRNWLNANSSNPDSVYDNEDDEGQNNKRGALAGLTEEGVRQNHRGRAANAVANSIPVSRNIRAGPMSEQQNYLNASSKQQGKFSIFADEDDDNNGYDLNVSIAHNNENAPLPRMVKQNDRMKENTLSAETWNERGGLHANTLRGSETEYDRELQGASSVVSRWASSTGDSIGAGGTSAQAAFQVFVDEDCAREEEAVKATKQRRTNDRGLKHRLDDRKQPFRPLLSSLSSSSIEGSESSLSRAKHQSNSSLTDNVCKDSLTSGNQMPRNEKVPLGFDKSLLIRKDKQRGEQCFEEHRAKLRKWKITPAAANFNLLHVVKDTGLSDSCMEFDETSTIDEIDMDEASRSISTIHEDRDTRDHNNESSNILQQQNSHLNTYNKEMKYTQPKKVLFGLNHSFGNRSSSRAAINTSTASSTIDERDAVGVVGDREETLNTRFAARELSMMFSSPMGLDHSVMPSAKKTCDKLLFPVYRDDSFASQDAVPESSHIAKKNKTEFAIFCDEDNQQSVNPKGESSFVQKSFAIHKIHEHQNPSKILKSEVATRFDIHHDESDSDDDSSGVECNGDTASLADIMDVMKDISPDGPRNPGIGRSSKSTGLDFEIFCDDDEGADSDKDLKVDDDIVLTADFGDLSFIPSAADGDTCNLQEELKNLSIS